MIKKIIVFSYIVFTNYISASELFSSVIELERMVKRMSSKPEQQDATRKTLLSIARQRVLLLMYYRDQAEKTLKEAPNVQWTGDYIGRLEHHLFPPELFVADYQPFKDCFFSHLRPKQPRNKNPNLENFFSLFDLKPNLDVSLSVDEIFSK